MTGIKATGVGSVTGNQQPPQHQDHQPGIESAMQPRPQVEQPSPINTASNKLIDKVAIVTGGDSGIGRAVAVAFAKEGADIVIVYLEEHQDAAETRKMIEEQKRQCFCIAGDLGQEVFCQKVVTDTIAKFGKIDILVNNVAEQHPQLCLEAISSEQLEKTFRTNIFSYFYLTKATLPYLKQGATIVNSSSVVAYHGNPELIDYSATKGAIVSFTRSLALSLINKGIRVNGVAPGPIWTPLIPASFSAEKVAHFGEHVPMKRVGQPSEVAQCYVFLACQDSSYMTGQFLHPNGGVIVNG